MPIFRESIFGESIPQFTLVTSLRKERVLDSWEREKAMKIKSTLHHTD